MSSRRQRVVSPARDSFTYHGSGGRHGAPPPLPKARERLSRPAPRPARRPSRRTTTPPDARFEDENLSSPTSDEEAQTEGSDNEVHVDYRGMPPPKSVTRQPLRIVDWRGEICRLLGLDNSTSDDTVLEELAKTEIILQEEAQRSRSEAFEAEVLPPRGQIVYRIYCHESRQRQELYLEEPWISRSGPYQSHLRAGDSIRNYELFLERNKDISFVIYNEFECCGPHSNTQNKAQYGDPTSPISDHFVRETISVVSEDLNYALQTLAREALSGISHPDFDYNSGDHITYPYLWWYHRRDEISKYKEHLDRMSREHISIFQEYLLQRLGADWDVVDSLIAKGNISSRYVEYLFIPGGILISKDEDDRTRIQGAVAESWLSVWRDSSETPESAARRPVGSINCLRWSFDGNFQRDTGSLRIKNIPSDKEKEIKITNLDVYPSRFAEPDILQKLRARGDMFWKCRKRRYVCYDDAVDDTMNMAAAPRFMVDIAIYKEMHPPDSQSPPKRDDLGPIAMSKDDPPLGDDFLLCLPMTIPGFNMQKKEWVTLDVGNVKDVEWNRDAFEMLVADEETKELVRALVENHCNAEKNTDLISGKGNGLFVLLHGAPGTGKTLTAETVAEIAEKPLYRVTCGDIGTKAEDVEKYLETVLLLGKTWSCVVLLDEADVFLEERTLFDLQRNALVSVFLRVLEYYEGILILTSNRVGIFDEAFKSRIQLTLRYKNLAEPQRKKIWQNLITRLEEHQKIRLRLPRSQDARGVQEQEIDFKDILANLDDLAKVELNGRQIRNAVSTARQLAMFRGKSMQFSDLKVVINESEKFDAYLKEVTGLSTDMIQRDKGLR